jgi:ABC-type sugar transport system ATPase subunit
MSEQVILEVRGARKQFGAVTALDGVSLALHRGEILALLGDNGAGKSTLIKALSGVHSLDEGEILLDGEPVHLRSAAAARAAGIETVFQNLAVFDNLNAADNFYIGRELARPRWLGGLGWLRAKSMQASTREQLDTLRVRVPALTSTLGVLSGGQRQAIACARAVAFASRIVILDEPTAALGVRESSSVLDLVRRLPQSGTSVILISHNLEQVIQVADRAVVLRQGRQVGAAAATAENHQELVSMIVGGGAPLPPEPQPQVKEEA